MKVLLSLLFVLIIYKDCNDALVFNNVQDNNYSITYQASTRGFFEEINVSKDSFSISNNVKRTDIKFYKTPAKDWIDIMKLLKQIEITQLPNLKAPTSMRQYDGAAYATLTVKNKSLKTQTKSFDQGYPPKEIKTLVEKLLTFKKLVSKQ